MMSPVHTASTQSFHALKSRYGSVVTVKCAQIGVCSVPGSPTVLMLQNWTNQKGCERPFAFG